MSFYCSSLYLFGIFGCFFAGTVADEAIVNGNVVRQGNPFPYHVAITIDGQVLTCGGGIIADEFIITAASCLMELNGKLLGKPIYVHAATNNLARPGIIIQVEKVAILKHFERAVSGTTDDIAILKLRRSLELEKNHAKLMRLNRPGHGQSKVDQTAVITGFGWNWVEIRSNKQFGGNNDTYLRYVEADLLSTHECQRDHPHLTITNRHLCARVKQYDSSIPRGVCLGDNGGPLVTRGRTIIGILVMSRFGCSERNNSAVYTRVSYYRQLIERATENRETTHVRFISALH